ncbi:MAG: tripartite tricarboxylate transporter substrate-binding protein [Burkholderiaceae bacterium]
MINDALGGHIVIGWVTPAAGAQYVAAGKLVPLAVADTRRARLMPNVPTLMELGYKDVEVSAWMAMLAPKGLPAAIAGRLNGLLNEIIKLPDVVERMNALGIVPAGGAPSVLAAQIRADLDRYGPAIRQLGIAAD